MIIRTHEDAKNDAVEDDKWISRRYTLRADGMGHSMHETYIKYTKEAPLAQEDQIQ